MLYLFFAALVLVSSYANAAPLDHLSFNEPHQPGNHLDGFTLGAGATMTYSGVRLTPQRQSRTGFVWTASTCDAVNWRVEFEFGVNGRTIGGDGFAFWYTDLPTGPLLGPVYGAPDYFTGLGIMFDTYNNDAKGMSPLVSVHIGDGTHKYNGDDDGEAQAVGSCHRPFRNPKSGRVKALVTYEQKRLTVAIDANGEDSYECVVVENVELGLNKHFGFSAKTGDVADSHDIFSFKVEDLTEEGADKVQVQADYQEALDASQESSQHLNAEQFQHKVLTALYQVQEEVNMNAINSDHLVAELVGENSITEKLLALEEALLSQLGSAEGSRGSTQQQQQQQQGSGSVTRSLQDLSSKMSDVESRVQTLQQTLNHVRNTQRDAGQADSKAGEGTALSWSSYTMLVVTAFSSLYLALRTYIKDKNDKRYKLG